MSNRLVPTTSNIIHVQDQVSEAWANLIMYVQAKVCVSDRGKLEYCTKTGEFIFELKIDQNDRVLHPICVAQDIDTIWLVTKSDRSRIQ